MGNWLRSVLVFFSMNFVCATHAEDITALVTGATSAYFTPTEKERFIEASDRFKKYEITREIETNSAYWL
ncbi:MAG: hypothetical protein RL083_1439, partial [Pseudomonadota bacterium]